MASISTSKKDGSRRILFVDPAGDRKTIHLGKVAQRAAETIRIRVEQLLEAKLLGQSMSADLAQWVNGLEPKLAEKMAKAGLIPRRERQSIRTFLDGYVERRTDVKPATRQIWRFVIADLCEFFGNERPLNKITEAEAFDFKQWLIDRKLSPATVSKRLQQVRSFFHDARRRKLVPLNPFAEVSAKSVVKLENRRFVTLEETSQILGACPNHTWRTIVGLARFGGLRCPSEVLSLRWQDVDWEKQRIIVQSPKTECHGKGTRQIPLFPELVPILTEAFELAPEGAVFVVDERYRRSSSGINGWRNCNLRTTFEKIIKRAGMEPWAKLFHALRSSRETELAANHPIHVVTAWMGNTPTIALRHYLLTTDADFERATRVNEVTQNPTRKPTQRVAAGESTESHDEYRTQAIAKGCDTVPNCANEENWGTRIRT